MYLFGLFAAILLSFVLCTSVHAANPTKVKLKSSASGKTYTAYDVTGDGKPDTIFVRKKNISGRGNLYVKINNKVVLNKYLHKLESQDDFYVTIYTLKNGKPFIRFTSRMREYVNWFDSLCQYRSGKLKTIVNFIHPIFKTCIVRQCDVSVKGNSLRCIFRWNGSTVGRGFFYFTYTYKNGTLVRTSNATSDLEFGAFDPESYNPCDYLVCKKTFPVYKDTNKQVKFYVPKGAKVYLTKVYFTAKHGVWYQIKYGSKKGWVKEQGPGILFCNVEYAPA